MWNFVKCNATKFGLKVVWLRDQRLNSTSLPNHSMCMCLYVSLCSLYAIPVWTVIENILLVPLYTLMVSDFLSQREDHESNLLISFLFLCQKNMRWASFQHYYSGTNLIHLQEWSSWEMTEYASYTSTTGIHLLIIQNMPISYGRMLLQAILLGNIPIWRLG